jgi:hypothetical protein
MYIDYFGGIMKPVKFVGIILIAFLSSSCSTMAEFYEPYRTPEERGYTVIRLKENEEPKIYSTNDLSNDVFDQISDHYVVLGVTSYNGPADNITDDIKMHCKKIGATVALYSITYTDTRYGSSYYQGTGGSYSIKRYDYDIYYFVKFIDDVGFGIQTIDLDGQLRQEYKRNTGAFVNIVYKNSPAFYANIVRGDIIIKINGIETFDADTAMYIINSFSKGDKISIEIIRNGRNETIDIII